MRGPPTIAASSGTFSITMIRTISVAAVIGSEQSERDAGGNAIAAFPIPL
jgi:hypothetical protein